MERKCDSCMYADLEADDIPCVDCIKSSYDQLYWMPKLEKLTDTFEMLRVLSQNQMYIMREISQIRKELEKLKEAN